MALDEALPYPPIARLLRELAQHYPALELTVLNGTAAEVALAVQSQRAQLGFQFDRGGRRTVCPALRGQRAADGVWRTTIRWPGSPASAARPWLRSVSW
jgi:hypothetical protein